VSLRIVVLQHQPDTGLGVEARLDQAEVDYELIETLRPPLPI
jgi:hypothetical protein